jgi:hypothetical protein
MFSDEQLKIINALSRNVNIKVSAIPGSGKSSTIYGIAKYHNASKILAVTYSSRLKLESKVKVEEMKLDNLEIQSYHSFFNNYYETCHDDFDMKDCLELGIKSEHKYDIIIVDEVQDMNELYKEAILKIMNDNQCKFKIVLLGDELQSIYAYKNSSPKYLIEGEKHFKNGLEWETYKLSISFRLTPSIAEFINTRYLDVPRINTIERKVGKGIEGGSCNGSDVKIDEYSGPKQILDLITNLKKTHGYKNSDFFILAHSLNNYYIKFIANDISLRDIHTYILPKFQNAMQTNDVKDKILFSTFHQSKGLERKVVIVIGLNLYLANKIKHKNFDSVKECIYVALTRAQEKLFLFNYNYKKSSSSDNKAEETKYTPFKNVVGAGIGVDKEYKYVNPFNVNLIDCEDSKNKTNRYVVTDVVDQLPFETLYEILKFRGIDKTQIIDFVEPLALQNKLDSRLGKMREPVDDINGLFCGNICETIFKRSADKKYVPTVERVCNSWIVNKPMLTFKQKKFLENMGAIKTKNRLLYLTMQTHLYAAIESGLWNRIYQISNYNYITHDHFANIVKKFYGIFDKFGVDGKTVDFEVPCDIKYKGLTIVGRVDAICRENKIIFEFKYVSRFRIEHILQSIIYGIAHQKKYKVVLFNVANGEYLLIEDYDKWQPVLDIIMKVKYHV